ncbi:MAG: CHRD domain-containing protein [Pseudomonadota bacterium]
MNIGGDGVRISNFGDILGTGNQRNGTIYADGSANNFLIDNRHNGTIDAGNGNEGAGIALQTGETDGDVVRASIVNDGVIAGRGQAAASLGTAGDGIRIFAGSDDVTFRGSINNDGVISSDSLQGTTAAIRVANGVNFVGEIDNDRGAVIAGAQNGVYFGEGTHHARIDNDGTISSGSRAVNIDGTGVKLDNDGVILGTGDQRNGTVYSDGTADFYSINNGHRGAIDAGEGNQGAGIALQTGDSAGDVVNADIVNRGDIDGRGQAASNTGLAGDGVRIFTSVGEATFRGDLFNSGDITSESAQGTTAGVRIADGVGFVGDITNTRTGDIVGAQNGLYFGNGAHNATVRNFGEIESDSRAVNIDGTGVTLINGGRIEGTGDQRNGTVYSDATADDYAIINSRRGDIDAGEGNQGAAVALQTGEVAGDVVSAELINRGEIDGRGQAASNTGLAGDGVRIFTSVGEATFQGDFLNSGDIRSESTQGTTAGVRIADGVGFVGEITNTRTGDIVGAQNGLYFGNGAHNATVRNFGEIQSASRAVNIDGTGVTLINDRDIEGIGDQRNGTVYADATADDYAIINNHRGDIDAGQGNNGSGVSLQTGDVDGDIVTASVTNHGDIIGRGDAVDGNTVGDGVRIFSGQSDVTFNGDINNTGLISASDESAAAVGISIEDGVSLDGQIVNHGRIIATETAIDAAEAGGNVNVLNRGQIEGDVKLSAGNDVFNGAQGSTFGLIDGGAGDDTLTGGREDNQLIGGLGSDGLNGGDGIDTAAYNDADVPVTVNLETGTATRETGFSLSFDDVSVAPLTLNTALSGDFVSEALNGNLYFNIHTNDFNGGEIRGQLDTIVDNTVGGNGTIVISGSLDASQEQGPTSDSEATGFGTVVINVVGGVAESYSLDLEVSGLATSDLLPVAGVSSIHIHNAPSGVNGPVTLDAVQDAGGDINGIAQVPGADTGDGNVFAEVIETDTLINIENVIGSNDADVIIGDAGSNRLEGLSGDDALTGGLNADVFVFGPANTPSNDTVSDYADGEDLFDVSAFGFTNFGDVGVAQQGADTLLTFAADNTVTLANVDAGNIDAGDFLFTV